MYNEGTTAKRGATVALVGERDLAKPAHAGIEASFALFQREVDPTLGFRWVPTADLAGGTPEETLGLAAGVWCVPGSPYTSTDGALQAIRFARERRRPFLGTCGGFQHALMEFYQNVLGGRAVHAELEAGEENPLIAKLTCSLAGERARVLSAPGSQFSDTMGCSESWEEFNCNYGLAEPFEAAFAGSSLEFVARDEAGRVRAFSLKGHPFFAGTLFQPERRALAGGLHPVVRAFLNQTRGVRG